MLLRLLWRTVILGLSVLLASIAVFAFMSVLPGDPAVVALGVNASPQALADLRTEFGTDRSAVAQYVDWSAGLVHGDFGVSYVTRAAIGPQLADRLQVTLWLVVVSMLLAVAVAVPAGIVAAVRHRRLDGAVVTGVSQLGVAVPSFVAGILLVDVFAVRLGWFPSGGWVPPAQDPAAFVGHLVLPVLSLGLVQAAVLTRYVRSAVLDVLREDYVRTARAKGLSPTRALLRHGLRNAAIPVITVLGLQIATLLISAVVVERVFVIPGLGSLLLDGVANRDLLLVQGVVMVLVLAVLLVNYVVDVLHVVVDPRLRRAT